MRAVMTEILDSFMTLQFILLGAVWSSLMFTIFTFPSPMKSLDTAQKPEGWLFPPCKSCAVTLHLQPVKPEHPHAVLPSGRRYW
jgi:hypothetical protein